jgi:hypothetical protein
VCLNNGTGHDTPCKAVILVFWLLNQRQCHKRLHDHRYTIKDDAFNHSFSETADQCLARSGRFMFADQIRVEGSNYSRLARSNQSSRLRPLASYSSMVSGLRLPLLDTNHYRGSGQDMRHACDQRADSN